MWLMLSSLATNEVVSEAVHLHPDSPPQMPDLQAELQPLSSASVWGITAYLFYPACAAPQDCCPNLPNDKGEHEGDERGDPHLLDDK